MSQNVLSLFKPIRAFVFDVDGVLTDGMLHLTEEGQQLRRMNIKDGYAMQLAVKKGYYIFIISGSTSEGVRTRLHKLGIEEVHLAVPDKLVLLQELVQKYNLQKEQLLYLGDDVPDHEAMQACGFPCAPQDAVQDIKNVATYISPAGGGMGCVRDVIEKVMKLNGDWPI